VISAVMATDITITEEAETTYTYKLTSDRIQGFTDELEALQQAIYKVLNTEKYESPIYSFSYGIELENLIGKDPAYVKIEMKRRVQECLLQDERIQSVDGFTYSITGDQLLCVFKVVSIYGDLVIEKEVTV
jgi:hypothetical protein